MSGLKNSLGNFTHVVGKTHRNCPSFRCFRLTSPYPGCTLSQVAWATLPHSWCPLQSGIDCIQTMKLSRNKSLGWNFRDSSNLLTRPGIYIESCKIQRWKHDSQAKSRNRFLPSDVPVLIPIGSDPLGLWKIANRTSFSRLSQTFIMPENPQILSFNRTLIFFLSSLISI